MCVWVWTGRGGVEEALVNIYAWLKPTMQMESDVEFAFATFGCNGWVGCTVSCLVGWLVALAGLGCGCMQIYKAASQSAPTTAAEAAAEAAALTATSTTLSQCNNKNKIYAVGGSVASSQYTLRQQ